VVALAAAPAAAVVEELDDFEELPHADNSNATITTPTAEDRSALIDLFPFILGLPLLLQGHACEVIMRNPARGFL
jgi:hypothetical protein